MSAWLLDRIQIEGFRGINNQGDPLILDFDRDSVNTVSAPNGVGKSSIFDTLSYAIRGSIPKLDGLQDVEKGSDYYLNRFNGSRTGTVALHLTEEQSSTSVEITVTLDDKGNRVVTAPPGVDGNALLASLNRAFVLLDAKTLQSFIDDKALARGRSFSGLLGLADYSRLSQELQSIANTRSFNKHFNVLDLAKKKAEIDALITRRQADAATAFGSLTQQALADQLTPDVAQATAHRSLHQMAVIADLCDGKSFLEIPIDDCVAAIKAAEGSAANERLRVVVAEHARLTSMLGRLPNSTSYAELADLAEKRIVALARTKGDLLRTSLAASKNVLESQEWSDKHLCPTCDRVHSSSILTHVAARLADYDAVEQATSALAIEWRTKGWAEVREVEALYAQEGEQRPFHAITDIERQSPSEAEVELLWSWLDDLATRCKDKLAALDSERESIQKQLPPSMVAATTAVEAARRLQREWNELKTLRTQREANELRIARVTRIKSFLDKAELDFLNAETNASRRRLAAVEPLCQKFFSAIVHQPVTPALVKKQGNEELVLQLSQFFGLSDVSAQALLSESFRNAFAVSVYLAAASLYGGAAKFVVLDDVTSSFDSGHQFYMMEVIRSQFARPGAAAGPQVILLSHDTLLEKLFNRYSNKPGWKHQRLEGTARTAVLPQSNAVNRVRDTTNRFLASGQVDDAAPRIRQYLEYQLLDIIQKLRIPVPIDFALDDNNKQVGTAIEAIEAAIKLHQAAGSLVLDAAQVTSFDARIASIVGNFMAHYATGSTGAFSAASLTGVMGSIDDLAECFKYDDPPNGRKYYRSLSRR